MKVSCTDHAIQKAKERLRWKASTTERMARKAYSKGVLFKDTVGELHEYIQTKLDYYTDCDDVRIYGEVVFFYIKGKLITLYRLSNRNIKYLKYTTT